jgi:hypothetical protein
LCLRTMTTSSFASLGTAGRRGNLERGSSRRTFGLAC